ncbi:MAG TPA: long-chain fatty acid--CoA ligase [Planctomycetaceae bacterium]|nr:long-chain fatty acid--CoA ligase [Planctomycetaceae bacterium]
MFSLGSLLPFGHKKLPWQDHYPAGVPLTLEYPREPLGWLLENAAARFPERIACHYYSQQLTYAELLSRARRLATVLLREGLQPGDRVGVLLPNLPEYVVALFGAWMAGGVVVALSPLMAPEQASALAKATGCRVVVTLDVLMPLICHGDRPPGLVLLTSLSNRLSRLERLGYAWVRFHRLGFRRAFPGMTVRNFDEAIAEAPENERRIEIDTHSPAYILPTGGTTGSPKAVVLSHRNLLANAWQISHWSRGTPGAETILAVLPFFHSYGLSSCLLNGMALGATLVLHHRFRPASVVRLIEQHRPTIFPAVPAMLSALNTKVLRKKKHDLQSLRSCISGGAPLPPQVAREFSEHTGCTVVEGYGLSEASPVTHAGPLDGTAIPGTIGLPLPDTEARIVDAATGTESLPPGEVGELAVKGPQVMLGYWNSPAETDRVLRDGWLYTGDLATCDENGFFRIVDRKKDLIITSGFNVYPADVEAVLRNYPGVRDVAVVGEPSESIGEIVKAVLVFDGKKFHRRDFDAFTRQHLAAHQRPKIVEIRTDDLPRNFLGKVLRRELRAALQPQGATGAPDAPTG